MNELLDYLHATYDKYMLERWKDHPKYGNGFSLGVLTEDNVYHSDVHDTLEECIQRIEAKIEAGRCEEVLEPLKRAEYEANLACDVLQAQLRRAQEEKKKARLARARAESELRLAQSYLRRSQNGGREEA